MPSNSIGNLMDFIGLGKIERDFVPLVEEVCSQHPSLIEYQQNRTLRFTEWAFTALGEFFISSRLKGWKTWMRIHLSILKWYGRNLRHVDLIWLAWSPIFAKAVFILVNSLGYASFPKGNWQRKMLLGRIRSDAHAMY